GPGTGKTLGDVAPARRWAEESGAAVWISTCTKDLQRQIDNELDRLYLDPREKAEKAVVRKGRENYLCLLNFEEALQGGAAARGDQIFLGLGARWVAATRDGDRVGGGVARGLAGAVGRAKPSRRSARGRERIDYAGHPYRQRLD